MKSLKGANVYITGGSSGIGLAFAKLAAQHGANIAIIARDITKLEDARKIIKKCCAGDNQKVEAYSIDVCNPKKLYKAIPDIIKKSGNPDVLVCAAGVGLSNYFENIRDDDFKQLMDINVFGIWYTLKAFYPYMKGRKTNCVLLSSLAGLIGVYSYSAYGTSKFAVFGLADCLRSEFKENGIALSVICPPEVDTPFLQAELATIPATAKRIKKITGVLSADTIAKAILKAVQKNTYMVVPGFMGKLTWLLHRLGNGFGTRLITDIIVRYSK